MKYANEKIIILKSIKFDISSTIIVWDYSLIFLNLKILNEDECTVKQLI